MVRGNYGGTSRQGGGMGSMLGSLGSALLMGMG
jgi:hypothetical protein